MENLVFWPDCDNLKKRPLLASFFNGGEIAKNGLFFQGRGARPKASDVPESKVLYEFLRQMRHGDEGP
jgi:hypothetical protein